MYSCDEPRFTVSSAPNFLVSTDSLSEAIRATKKCLTLYGRVEYHDNVAGEVWRFTSPTEPKPS